MNKLLVVSYYANIKGACQSEWLEDKLDSFKKLGNSIELISANCSGRYRGNSIAHFQVNSVSPVEFGNEVARLLNDKSVSKQEKIKKSIFSILYLPALLSIGILFDIMLAILTKGWGEGRWSWAIPAFFAIFWRCMMNRPELIVSTGGPAAPHIAACCCGRLLNIPVIIEFQDPLSGDGIGRNNRSKSLLQNYEGLIIGMANKVVYVTDTAAKNALEWFGGQGNRSRANITAVYPGARNFNLRRSKHIDQMQRRSKPLSLIHLGSLYSTRNFDTLIAAVEHLIASGAFNQNDFRIINLGHVAIDIRERLEKVDYVEILKPVDRLAALKFASQQSALLLIQNNDARSNVTIPYKTYDYLNLDIPILALTNSEEIKKLLVDHDHSTVAVGDVNSISEKLITLFEPSGIEKDTAHNQSLDAIKQAQAFLEL